MWTLKQWLQFNANRWDVTKRKFNEHHGENALNICINSEVFLADGGDLAGSGEEDYPYYVKWFNATYSKLGRALK